MLKLRKAIMVALMPLMMLTSCASTQEDTTPKTKETHVGVLQRVDLRGDATHASEYLFVSDDLSEDDLYLTSRAVILDKYLDDHIEIIGVMDDATARLFLVEQAEEVDKKNAVTTKMMSYTNRKMGLYFTYPDMWSVSSRDDSKLEISNASSREPIAELFKVSGDEDFEAWIARNYEGKETTSMQLGLTRATRIEEPDNATEVIVADVNDHFYTMNFTYAGSDTEVVDYYAELQKSLRFTTPDELATEEEDMDDSDNPTLEVDEDGVISEKEDDSDAKVDEVPTHSEDDTKPMDDNPTDDEDLAGSDTAATSSSDEETAETAPEASADEQDLVNYVLSNPAMLPSEESATIQEVEIANGNYVYVTFMDGDTKKKVLYQYSGSTGSYSFDETGLFEAGDTTDWVKVSGSNVAGSKSREVFAVEDGSAEKTASVQAGKSLYSNSYLDVTAQYPRNWYYAAESISSEGGVQKITFSNKPGDEDPDQKVEIKVYNKGQFDTSGGTETTIGGKKATVVEVDGETKYVIEGEDGTLYVTSSSGDDFSREAMADVIDTLQD